MRREFHVRYGISCALLAAALWTGCEDPGTGTLDPRGNAPFLSSAVVSPNSINLGGLPSGPSGLIATTITTVRMTDPDPTGVVTAVVEVYTPDDTPVASAPLLDDGVTPDRAAGDGVFTARVQFSVTESDAGRCRVRFSAVDELGLRANVLEESLVLSRAKPNSPPVLSDLVAPDTVTRPTTGELPITLSIGVTDPDGYADIREVFFRSLDSSAPDARIALWDDGGAGGSGSGDEFANDGVFTRIIKIKFDNEPKDYRFAFQATDTQGGSSAVLLHVLTVK